MPHFSFMSSCRRGITIFFLATSVLVVAACSRSAATPPPPAGSEAIPPPAASHNAPSPATSAAPESNGVAPAAGAQGAPAGVQTASGTVVETMNAGNYTYVRVKSGSKELWAATAQFPVAVGDKVTIPLESTMENFHSQSLNRDFPLIYFVSHIDREGAPAAGASPHGGAPTSAAAPSEPIAPPAGGMPIEKVWADRKGLAGKNATVKGKVVKYNAGIMGKNWIHIQDGSGKAADGTNDLTVTTNDQAKVGDLIEVTGKVNLDRDFGAGYKYAVILEDARIK